MGLTDLEMDLADPGADLMDLGEGLGGFGNEFGGLRDGFGAALCQSNARATSHFGAVATSCNCALPFCAQSIFSPKALATAHLSEHRLPDGDVARARARGACVVARAHVTQAPWSRG